MGILTRKSGDNFIITSDRMAGELPTNRPPRLRPTGDYQVWTGDKWSATMTDAKTFAASGMADEYVRMNYAQVVGPTSKR